MLELKNIEKRYDYKKILHRINMQLPDCGMIGIAGPSGCGKSTLLNIIGGLDKEFSGDLLYNGKSVKLRVEAYRRKYVSFIFQKIHLITWLSPADNVKLSSFFKVFYKGNTYNNKIEFHQESVSNLSHGQRGLLSYMRAFFYDKDIILADEPTGAMDFKSAGSLYEKLKDLSQDRLIVIVSHDIQLLEHYCDEIYFIKDGYLDRHIVLNEIINKRRNKEKAKNSIFSFIKLSLFSLVSHKKRTSQVILGVFLSMMCMLSTITLSKNLEQQLYNYVYSLVPPSSISVYSHEPITMDLVNDIQQNDEINRLHLFADECELLGLSFDKTRYKYSSTLFISDDSSPYHHLSLKEGAYPQNDNEIMISLSTARHLADDNIEQLINKSIYGWYKIFDSTVALEYKIVGITSLNTQSDVIYQKENAYMRLLKSKGIETKSNYGIIYIDDQIERSQIVEVLKKEYKQLEFKESGKSTIDKMNSLFDKMEVVLLLFSVSIIMSSIILMGEVTFLNVVIKRKDFAIMKCFGATTFDLLRLIVIETMEIVLFCALLLTCSYYSFIYIVNAFLKDIMLVENFAIKGNMMHIIVVIVYGFMLMFISQIISMLYIVKLNTTEALKD